MVNHHEVCHRSGLCRKQPNQGEEVDAAEDAHPHAVKSMQHLVLRATSGRWMADTGNNVILSRLALTELSYDDIGGTPLIDKDSSYVSVCDTNGDYQRITMRLRSMVIIRAKNDGFLVAVPRSFRGSRYITDGEGVVGCLAERSSISLPGLVGVATHARGRSTDRCVSAVGFLSLVDSLSASPGCDEKVRRSWSALGEGLYTSRGEGTNELMDSGFSILNQFKAAPFRVVGKKGNFRCLRFTDDSYLEEFLSVGERDFILEKIEDEQVVGLLDLTKPVLEASHFSFDHGLHRHS
ncbi:Hypothetical predicted protein [Prunus dulcis]|uniref:Uncharacterized protein n=1 Tax=Prunus dulcis TaxID=3755 RepID=A0A5E4F108_PRUDU|nr:Hypothetical predicted protein [Prunus dulcis]